MPILDPIDLELWNEYFREALSGTGIQGGGRPDEIVYWSAAIADAALAEYEKRMKEVSSK